MNKLFLEKVKTDYSIVELVKCSVIFSLEHSRELRKRILTEFVPTPIIPSKETISIEYESTKTKRFDWNKAKREMIKVLETKMVKKTQRRKEIKKIRTVK